MEWNRQRLSFEIHWNPLDCCNTMYRKHYRRKKNFLEIRSTSIVFDYYFIFNTYYTIWAMKWKEACCVCVWIAEANILRSTYFMYNKSDWYEYLWNNNRVHFKKLWEFYIQMIRIIELHRLLNCWEFAICLFLNFSMHNNNYRAVDNNEN